MTSHRFNIGPLSTRRRIATVIAVIGVFFVGSRLASVWPRAVDVSYEVDSSVSELDVDYLQEGEAVSSARFRSAGGAEPRFFRHTVRLRPGEYQLHITLYGHQGDAEELRRSLTAPASHGVRFDLRSAGETGGRRP